MARVLVIDDDFLVTHLLKEHLTNEGHQVTTAQMAEEGFSAAVKTPPDLIMLDVNLPDATGFQMCGRLRENPITRAIPIVMMTGAARSPNQQAIGRQMGANDYILKPFNVIEVGDRIKNLIPPKRDMRVIETGDKTPVSSSIPTLNPPKVNHSEDHRNGKNSSFVPSFESVTDLLSHVSNGSSSSSVQIETKAPEKQAPRGTPLLTPHEEPAPPESRPATDLMDETLAEVLHPRLSLSTFGYLFAIQIGLSIVTSLSLSASLAETMRSATLVAGGWALLLGLMVAVCAILQIDLAPRMALQILSWAAVPIVLRSAGILVLAKVPSLSLLHTALNAARLPAAIFWLRPLDLFETASVVILGLSIRQRLRSSILKSLLAAILIGLAWCLTARGYFQPF